MRSPRLHLPVDRATETSLALGSERTCSRDMRPPRHLTARCSCVHGSGAKAKIKGHLPLLAVAGDGPIEVVRSILDAKVDVNELHATTGHTGLHLAAKAGRDDLLQLILDKVGRASFGALPPSPAARPISPPSASTLSSLSSRTFGRRKASSCARS